MRPGHSRTPSTCRPRRPSGSRCPTASSPRCRHHSAAGSRPRPLPSPCRRPRAARRCELGPAGTCPGPWQRRGRSPLPSGSLAGAAFLSRRGRRSAQAAPRSPPRRSGRSRGPRPHHAPGWSAPSRGPPGRRHGHRPWRSRPWSRQGSGPHCSPRSCPTMTPRGLECPRRSSGPASPDPGIAHLHIAIGVDQDQPVLDDPGAEETTERRARTPDRRSSTVTSSFSRT